MTLMNWAGNLTYGARDVFYPRSVDELREIASRSGRLRVLGSRHSFNEIADTRGNLVSLERMPFEAAVSSDGGSVTVSGAATYGALARLLQERGLALRNLASLPHISVAGSCATATHGSGAANRNLSSAVTGMEMVLPGSGELARLSRSAEGNRFDGMVVHLGALGIVTRLTLETVPTYQIAQSVYDNLPMEVLRSNFDEVLAGAYSVSLFTTWRADVIDQVWVKRKVEGDVSAPEAEREYFGAAAASERRHPIGDVSAVNCTQQLGVPGPWHERLPHFRYEHTPSHGEELQTEYFVARADAFEALRAVGSLRERIAPLLLVSEIRAVAADSLWMSPSYQRDSVGIHFTWKPDWATVRELLPEIERRLAPFEPRPHWAKLFTMPGEQIARRYEKLPNFLRLMREFDPESVLRNAFLSEALGLHDQELALSAS